jgi:hypothetical protein
MPNEKHFSYIMTRTSYIGWEDDDISFLLDQHSKLDSWNNSHVAPLWHIVLNNGQPVFTLTPYCCMINVERVNSNFMVFGLIRPGLEALDLALSRPTH